MPWSLQEVEEIDKLLQDPSVGPEVKAMFAQKKQAQEQADAAVGVTEDSLDPGTNMVAQMHAVMPKGTGEGAVDPQGALERSGGNGIVFFYEPPRQWVQQKMADPAVRAALKFDAQHTPEELANAGPGDPLYDMIVDEEWRKAGSAADAAGKTGYRYRDNDWLHGGTAMEKLKNFGTKLQAALVPGLESASSFVLGVDDTAGFKLGQNVASITADDSKARLSGAGGDEYVRPGRFNSITGESPTQRELQGQLREDNPGTVLGGQIAGVASPWGLTNRLANYVTSGLRTALPSATGIPLAAAAGATTGATMGGAQLAADTAGRSIEQGQYAPPSPDQVGNAAMEVPYGAGLGAAGEMVGQGAGYLANRLRRGRFPGVPQGAIGDLEQVGDLNISTTGGVKPTPAAQDIVEEGFRTRSNPIDVSSERLAPKLMETAAAEREALKAETQTYKQKFYETPEGRSKTPTQNYSDSLMKQLRRHSTTSAERGVVEPNDAAGKELVGRFNTDVVDGVSLRPRAGSGGVEAAEISEPSRQSVMQRLSREWTPEEARSANGHVMARHYEINEALRTGRQMTPEMASEYQAMVSSLDKAVTGGHVLPGKTMRGVSVSEAELAQLEKAETLSAQGVISQSTDPKVAKQFSEWGLSDERPIPVLFEIQQRTGVPMGNKQGEIVHRPGTQYEVIGKTERDGVRVFQVRETGYSPTQQPAGGSIDGGLLKGSALAQQKGPAGGGQIELTPEEAEAYLAPVWQKRVLPDKAPSPTQDALDKKLGKKPEGFAAQLKAQGVERVYVTPKRRTAQESEDLMDDLDVWKGGKTVPGEVLNELDAGLRADRAARSPEFDAGLKQRSERRTQLDTMTERTTGHGNEQRGQRELQTNRALSQFGRGGRGSKPMDNAMRQLADKAGNRPELEAHASLDPMLRLSEASQFIGGNTGVLGDSWGVNVVRPSLIRSFPAARALGAEATSPIRQGRAARAGAVSIPPGLAGIDRGDALIRQQLQQDEENKP